MTNGLDYLEVALEERDRTEQKLLPLFIAFNEASLRVYQATLKANNSDNETGSTSTGGELDLGLIEKLNESRRLLERKVQTLQYQLDEVQEGARAMAEEQYLKTHAVQGLQDEILALTMQLNLSEEKRKKLQDDTGR